MDFRYTLCVWKYSACIQVCMSAQLFPVAFASRRLSTWSSLQGPRPIGLGPGPHWPGSQASLARVQVPPGSAPGSPPGPENEVGPGNKVEPRNKVEPGNEVGPPNRRLLAIPYWLFPFLLPLLQDVCPHAVSSRPANGNLLRRRPSLECAGHSG